MKQILIVEPDEKFAVRLFQALLSAGDYQISSTPTVRQACLVVGRQVQDLAFVPLEGLGGTVEALRRLQPDLPLVVTVPHADTEVPDPYADQVQGILPRPALGLGLLDFLDGVWEKTVSGPTPLVEEQDPEDLNGALGPLLQGNPLPETMLAALVSQGPLLLAHAGTLSGDQAELVVDRIDETWVPGLTAQIQFMLLPSRSSDLQLYTRPVGARLLLTLVARPETTMEAFRAQADLLAQQVASVGGSDEHPNLAQPGPVATVRMQEPGPVVTDSAYALAWGSVQPLPEPLQIALRRTLQRIAAENLCELSHLDVEESLVHLVVRCPPDRSSSWIAHLFKREAERAIQTEFAVDSRLWQRGYFAAESDEPLSEAELDLILNRRREM